MGFALQIGGSLLAILALAWLAHGLGLGGDARIASEEDARVLADEAAHGFAAREVAIDRDGRAALCRDPEGRMLVLRRHGSHWAARLLGRDARVQVNHGRLTVATGDRRFGDVTVDLGGQAADWAARLGGKAR